MIPGLDWPSFPPSLPLPACLDHLGVGVGGDHRSALLHFSFSRSASLPGSIFWFGLHVGRRRRTGNNGERVGGGGGGGGGEGRTEAR